MGNEQKEHIRSIREKLNASTWVKGILNNAIKALAQDLYSKDTHFIFELIQNAEDNFYYNKMPFLSFKLFSEDPIGIQSAKGALIVENNEIGFSPKNVEAICKVGETTKNKSQGYIGEKGIGFKSVFRVTTLPYIFSNGYYFCLPECDEEIGLGYIVPKWIERIPEQIDKSLTTIVLPLDKEDYGYSKNEKMLQDIEPETILFLSKLKEIHIETDYGDMLTILKDDNKFPMVQILVEGKKQGEKIYEVNEFVLFKKSFDKPEDVYHEKRENINTRDVSIAFPLNQEAKSAGKIFAYLPIRKETDLPFIINSDFILTSSREEIQRDTSWNKWLIDCVAMLLQESLSCLKEKGLLTVPFLENLASSINKINDDSILSSIVLSVHESLKNEELLPANDGSFVTACDAKLARGSDLRELLSNNQLCSLFQSKNEIKWLSSEITEDRTPALYNLVKTIGVKEIRPLDIINELSDFFIQEQADDWMVAFYKFLGSHKEFWRSRYQPLFSKKFIRLQDGSHITPFKNDGSPNAYLKIETEFEASLPTVKAVITKHEDVRQFFKDFGIPDFDIVEEVIEKILPKYTAIIPINEHMKDIVIIERAYNTDSQEKKGRLITSLKKTPFVLSENFSQKKQSYKLPSEVYFQNDTLIEYFADNATVFFVNTNYSQFTLELLKNIGVADSVIIERKMWNWQRHVTVKNYHGCHERGLNGFDPNIIVHGLKYALSNPTIEKSVHIWNKIAIQNSDCIRGVIEKATRQTYENSTTENKISEFGRLLTEKAWLPNQEGEFLLPSELYLDDLPEQFIRNENLAEQLYMKKNNITKFAEEVGVSMEDIEFIKKHRDIFSEWKETIAATKEIPVFPTRPVYNPERRQEMLLGQLNESKEKKYDQRERSIRTTRGTIDPNLWLKNLYTNEDDEMICQICKEAMPFRKRDGEYYFETVEALSRNYFELEHEAQYLALCPVCAAMYKEFIKSNENSMKALHNEILNIDLPEISLTLGEQKISIKFVESHFVDIKTILDKAE